MRVNGYRLGMWNRRGQFEFQYSSLYALTHKYHWQRYEPISSPASYGITSKIDWVIYSCLATSLLQCRNHKIKFISPYRRWYKTFNSKTGQAWRNKNVSSFLNYFILIFKNFCRSRTVEFVSRKRKTSNIYFYANIFNNIFSRLFYFNILTLFLYSNVFYYSNTIFY